MARPKKQKGLNETDNFVIIEHGGVGTTIANVLEVTGIKKLVEIFVDGKDCGCKEREVLINKELPYRFKARCLTQEEYNSWKQFQEVRTLRLEKEQVKYVCELYAGVFNRQIWYPDCYGCSGTVKILINMIDKLDKVHETYEK